MSDANLPSKVSIREVGPRDGFQNEPTIGINEKLAIIEAVLATGVRRVELTSFVSPSGVPQLADAEAVWAAVASSYPEVEFSALVPNVRGARRAVDAGCRTVNYVVSASDSHSIANTGRNTAEALGELEEVVSIVGGAGGRVQLIVATSFGCPYEGEVAPARVLSLLDRAEQLGLSSISMADTTGMATPLQVRNLVVAVQFTFPRLDVNLHFHDTRGTGLANVLIALQAGISDFDASIGGLGGCPFAPGASGNIATEDLVYMLDEMGVETGIGLSAGIEAARVATRVFGRELPSKLLRAGPRLVARGLDGRPLPSAAKKGS